VKKVIILSSALYFLLGQMFLPNGDFSVMPDLPFMFAHCKATEDKDLSVLDFITDHLINIDGLFDSHNNGDQQKPHKPFNFNHLSNGFVLISQIIKPEIIRFKSDVTIEMVDELPYSKQHFFQNHYLSSIFRPPIFV
jgi:hypothetical protein